MHSMVFLLIKILASFPGLTLLQLLIACSMQILQPWPHDTASNQTKNWSWERPGNGTKKICKHQSSQDAVIT